MARKGIPTEYAGVRFRSRLEAQWAAFFDLLQWPWEYEPFDLKGYIPDFLLSFPFGEYDPEDGTHFCTGSVIVDIKPLASLHDLAWRGDELARCGYEGPAFVCGATLLRDFHGGLAVGSLVRYVAPWFAEKYPDFPQGPGMQASGVYCREKFSHTEIYRHEGHSLPFGAVKCLECGRVGHSAFDGCAWCGVEMYDFSRGIDDVREQVVALDDGIVRSAWTSAKNRVQWKGEFGV